MLSPKPDKTLMQRTITGGLGLLITLWVAMFFSAGTLAYWQAWIFWLVFSASVTAITIYLIKFDRALLERRVDAGPGAEKEKGQKIIQFFTSLAFIFLIIVPGLDYRFHWSNVPVSISVIGDILVAVGLYIVFMVFKINSFTSATIEIGKEQQIVSTGPYGIVRHPMYAGALLMCNAIPLALGSYWAFIFSGLMVAGIVWRLLEEENFLVKNLEGYKDYQKQVRYHLVPLIW
jgi:protein-S-isoprenylcysteine O-methyltransferase Ste14